MILTPLAFSTLTTGTNGESGNFDSHYTLEAIKDNQGRLN